MSDDNSWKEEICRVLCHRAGVDPDARVVLAAEMTKGPNASFYVKNVRPAWHANWQIATVLLETIDKQKRS